MFLRKILCFFFTSYLRNFNLGDWSPRAYTTSYRLKISLSTFWPLPKALRQLILFLLLLLLLIVLHLLLLLLLLFLLLPLLLLLLFHLLPLLPSTSIVFFFLSLLMISYVHISWTAVQVIFSHWVIFSYRSLPVS